MYYLMFKEAWISVFSNKMRSGLTILGVVIGVCAVVLMVEVGQAVTMEVDKQVAGFGANTFIIVPAAKKQGAVNTGRGTAPTLTIDDAEAIKKIKGVLNTAPILMRNFQVKYGAENWNTMVQGSNSELPQVFEKKLARGEMFTERDVRTGTSVVVIGNTIVEKLFTNGQNPIGRDIKIKGIPFKIIGVFDRKGSDMMGNDQDDNILMPFKTYKSRLTASPFPRAVRMIVIKFDDIKNMKLIENRIYALLQERHNITDDSDLDFELINLVEIMQKITAISVALSILLASTASISLFVGSIGIMNMMLTSVTERTKEIGIRKAIGAPNISILFQFLVESILVSLVGSVIGMVLGIIFGQIGAYVSGFPVPVSITTIIVAMVVAILVGILSGIIPARKATGLNPIDALRFN